MPKIKTHTHTHTHTHTRYFEYMGEKAESEKTVIYFFLHVEEK